MDFQRDLYEIQLLKARFVRYMDTRSWDAWRELLADDLVYYIDEGPTPDSTTPTFTGADALLAHQTSSDPGKVSIHQVHSPEIEFLDENTATGVWAMFSWSDNPRRDFGLKQYGHYHDRYVRGADGKWRISSIHLTALRRNAVDHLPSERVDVVDKSTLPSHTGGD